MSSLHLSYKVIAGDMGRAGEASSAVKQALKKRGFDSTTIRRVSVCLYEGEINMVIHANGGTAEVDVDLDDITITLKDTGPGIPDVGKAMQEGFSTACEHARNLGFGAGMGLPNMIKYTDDLRIDTVVGEGTTITMTVLL